MELKVIDNLIEIPRPSVTISLEQLQRNITTLRNSIARDQIKLAELESHLSQAIQLGVKSQVEISSGIKQIINPK